MIDVYERLRQKLDTMTKGYPKTESGAELIFLRKIFTAEDAEFFIKFKPGLQSVEAVAEQYGMTPDRAQARLEDMSRKHLMYWEREGTAKKYRIVPYIHGLWEFNVDRIDATDAKNMGTLYVSGFARSFMDYRLPMSRVIPIRAETVNGGKLLPGDDYAGAIRKQDLIVATDCACRKVALFARRPCSCTDNLNVCYVFGQTADYYLEMKIGNPRIVSKEEIMDRIKESEKVGHYLCAGHTREIQALCNCAKCHCGFLMAAKISLGSSFENWSNYSCVKNEDLCIDCGNCIERCPMRNMQEGEDGKILFDSRKCMGCGLCVTTCPAQALILERKPDDKLTFAEDEKFYDLCERMGAERIAIDRAREAAKTANKRSE
jgi:Na+-translocating ferredoxin:NAD+ oxidoreductase subunit B